MRSHFKSDFFWMLPTHQAPNVYREREVSILLSDLTAL